MDSTRAKTEFSTQGNDLEVKTCFDPNLYSSTTFLSKVMWQFHVGLFEKMGAEIIFMKSSIMRATRSRAFWSAYLSKWTPFLVHN